jgi:outer membrane protein assembly factor BamB
MCLKLACHAIVGWIAIAIVLPSVGCSQRNTTTKEQVRTTTQDQVRVEKTTNTESEQDWPRFLGNRFDGSVEQSRVSIDWGTPPVAAWSIEVGDGYGLGTVSEGRFFQLDASRQFDAVTSRLASRERLRCFDFVSGAEIWSKSNSYQYSDLLGYEDGPRTSPTVVGDRVITYGVTGVLKCRQVKDGAEIWSVDTNADYGVVQNFFGVGSSPLVLDDKVIVMVGGSPPEDQNIAPMQLDRVTYNGTAVVAFDLENGREVWRTGDDLASYSSPRPITIDGTEYVLVFARTGLLLVDPMKGKTEWQFEHRASIRDSVNAMVPVVSGDQVFISECYELGSALLQVSKAQPRVIWKDPPRDRRRQAMRSHWATPVLVDGFLYGCSGRNAPDSDLRCISWETGQVEWVDSRRIRSSLARIGDHLVLLEERGLMQILQVNSKQLEVVAEWDLSEDDGARLGIKYPCWAAPVIVGNRILVRGTDRIQCLEFALEKKQP